MSERKSTAYFAYGPKTDPELMSKITGQELIGKPAVARSAEIVIIRINEIPEHNQDGSPSAKRMLEAAFGSHYLGYALKPTTEETATAKGVLYTLDEVADRRVHLWDTHFQGWLLDKSVSVDPLHRFDRATGSFSYFERSLLLPIDARSMVLPDDTKPFGYAVGEYDAYMTDKNIWIQEVESFINSLPPSLVTAS